MKTFNFISFSGLSFLVLVGLGWVVFGFGLNLTFKLDLIFLV